MCAVKDLAQSVSDARVLSNSLQILYFSGYLVSMIAKCKDARLVLQDSTQLVENASQVTR